jgi:cytochrome b involved in lipid metabolism
LTVIVSISALFSSFLSAEASATSNDISKGQLSQTTSTTANRIERAIAASYTLAEVAENNSRSSCWTVISGFVYNLTEYIKRHPGGESAIAQICGVDGTSIFNNMHGGASTQAAILATYKIGVLSTPTANSCAAGNFFSSGMNNCIPAPVGFFVTAEDAAAGSTQASPCPSGFTTATTGSKSVSDCYKPIVQSIVGLKVPKALKFRGSYDLALITNAGVTSTSKVSGPCTAKLATKTTVVSGKKVITKMLRITAGTKAGTCSINLSSPAQGKYLKLNKVVQIKVSKTGK